MLSTATETAGPQPMPGDKIRSLVSEAAHWLPSQGPIEVFVHHNTLHALEHLPFHEAVKAGLERFGGQPYLSESHFHHCLRTGRIRATDLKSALARDLGAAGQTEIAGLAKREEIRFAMLLHLIQAGSPAELQWILAETETLTQFRSDIASKDRDSLLAGAQRWLSETGFRFENESLRQRFQGLNRDRRGGSREVFALNLLWNICQWGVEQGEPEGSVKRWSRPRDLILAAFEYDSDRDVHGELIRFCGVYLDQGYSDWSLPERKAGFLTSFLRLHTTGLCPPTRWARALRESLLRIEEMQLSAEQIIADSLTMLEVPEARWMDTITQTLLSLRGWAGMIWQMEQGTDGSVHPIPEGALTEFVAVQLLLECLAYETQGMSKPEFRNRAGNEDTLQSFFAEAHKAVEERADDGDYRQAYVLFQIAQVMGWEPDRLANLTHDQWAELLAEVNSFDELERRRIFQEAYEEAFRRPAIDAICSAFSRWKSNRNTVGTPESTSVQSAASKRPRFQVTTCIDDREESFRRHLEEVQPECETYGAAGFFAVAMNYRGAADGFYQPLCPAVITPTHFVQEDVGYTFQGLHKTRAQLRRRLGRASHSFQWRSRTLLGGIAAGIVGSLATAPLVAQVLFPHLTARLQRRFGSFLQPPPVTTLQLERYAEPPGPDNGHIGYSLEEMADVVVRLLEDMGLYKAEQFSRLFIICGHGSSSLNNPHESAYCCGACAGKRGGPNARAFAEMANDWRIRQRVAQRGIELPEDTFFVGAYHNTCDDSVVFYDLDRLPASHRSEFDAARRDLETARMRNAHERCRRFESAPLTLTPEEALRHVEARAQDIAQARPEYNHATNALCLVGRREWSRGLYLDRRAFLTTYDPTTDDDQHSVLTRILAAAIPVCAGINLEYYFSKVDHVVYGAGSKLPHNLVSLLGVMEGTSSDLRTGLYQQMVEIHEPVRITFVIESTPEAMLAVMKNAPAIERLCRGEWVHLAVIEPETGDCYAFRQGNFEKHAVTQTELEYAKSSEEWYAGHREDLPFCFVERTEVAS